MLVLAILNSAWPKSSRGEVINLAMAQFKIRIIGNACLTRYDGGETPIDDVVSAYNLAEEDENLVWAHIYSKRPDLGETTEMQPETPAAE